MAGEGYVMGREEGNGLGDGRGRGMIGLKVRVT